MEDMVAYIIIGIVVFWFCLHIYKKVNVQEDQVGCGGGCGGCSTSNDSCSDTAVFHERKL